MITESLTSVTVNGTLTVDLDAVAHNIKALRGHLPSSSRFLAIIKASAYGTAPVTLASFLLEQGIDLLGVAFLSEAIELRQAGVTTPILVLQLDAAEAHGAVHWNVEVAVDSPALIDALAQQGSPIKVHLNVNTGINRLGYPLDEADQLIAQIEETSLILEGLMSHLASDQRAAEQVARFVQLADRHPHIPWKHIASTTGTIQHSAPQCNMVRIGLGLFGHHPTPVTRHAINLHPALSLSSRLIAIHTCNSGEYIGYGESFCVKDDGMRVGVIPLGYFDGIPYTLSNRGEVVIEGRRLPIVGTVCMDFMMVDLTAFPEAAVGDRVLIFGDEMPVEEVAATAGLPAHALLTCLGPRIQRHLKTHPLLR